MNPNVEKIQWPSEDRKTLATRKLEFISEHMKQIFKENNLKVTRLDLVSEIIKDIDRCPSNDQLSTTRLFLAKCLDDMNNSKLLYKCYGFVFHHSTLYGKERVIENFESIFGPIMLQNEELR